MVTLQRVDAIEVPKYPLNHRASQRSVGCHNDFVSLLRNRLRGERKVLRPSQRALEIDYERLIVLDRLDKREACVTRNRDRRGKGIGKTEVRPTDAR